MECTAFYFIALSPRACTVDAREGKDVSAIVCCGHVRASKPARPGIVNMNTTSILARLLVVVQGAINTWAFSTCPVDMGGGKCRVCKVL